MATSKPDTVKIEKEIAKKVHDLVSQADKGPQKEVVPSNTSVIKRTKKPTHRPQHSPERRPIVEEVPKQSISSPKEVTVSKAKRIRKLQLSRKGVVIREIPTPVSPASKKRSASAMVKKLKKK